jgi:triacylglycerol lipase
VVLVHGTFGNRGNNWQTYAPLLANHGYCVYSFTYGLVPESQLLKIGGLAPMQHSARQLESFVAKVRSATGARQVDLIGHSQGTLMPTYYLKFLGGAPFVHRYISLASLWHGTATGTPFRLAAQLFGVDDSLAPLCKACAQFTTGSPFMAKLRSGGVAVPGVQYTNIVTKYDELVRPYTSGIEPGMRNIVLQDRCPQDLTEHGEIAADPVAAQIVLNSLDPAHPEPVKCTLVLPFTGPVG